jgi:hypothetical protein
MKIIKNEEDKEGVLCKCGKFTEFALYVYAHWGIKLVFVCQECGSSCNIKKGKIIK